MGKNKRAYKTRDRARLPLNNKPELRAENAPGRKLRKLNVPVCVMDQPKNPPIETAATPTYGPRIIPMKGAKIEASAMVFPRSPMTEKSDTTDKIAYKAAKTHIKAKSLVLNRNTASF